MIAVIAFAGLATWALSRERTIHGDTSLHAFGFAVGIIGSVVSLCGVFAS